MSLPADTFLTRSELEALEDAEDAAIADERLADIKAHPEHVIRGEELEATLKEWVI